MRLSVRAAALILLFASPLLAQDVFRTDTPVASATATTVTKKVLFLIYDPVMSDGRKLHVYKGWYDPNVLFPQILDAIRFSSGGYVDYQVVETHDLNEWPAMQGNFRYTETSYLACLANNATCYGSDFDFLKMFNDYSICSKLQSGTIDEVVIYGAPWFATDEFAWKTPGDVLPYYTPTNGQLYSSRTKNIPDCGKTVFVMGYSYERGLGEALESFGHRLESAVSVTVGRGFWDGCVGNATLGASDWDHFTCIDRDKTPSGVNVAGCGGNHSPPNSRWDLDPVTNLHDDYNTAYVNHACPSWANYPFTTKTIVNQNCNAWGCDRVGFLKWWMAGLPKNDGLNTKGNLNNWWRYVVDYDNAVAAAVIPNLTPTAITRNVPSPVVGSPVTFDSGITNAGFKGTGTFSVKWFVDGAQVGYGGHTAIPKNTTVSNGNSQYTHTFTTSGTHTVTFRVDADGAVAEYNEGDNDVSTSVSVAAGTPTFSNLSASLGCTATFNFSYSGTSSNFIVDLGLASDMVVGTYLSFGSGASSPITVANAAAKWASYRFGTPMWFRVRNADGSVVSPIQYANTVTCNTAPTFSNLSASLGCTATFNFSYSGTSSNFIVDLGLASDMVIGTYLSFGSGASSPITVANAWSKWTSYTYGTPMWFRVKNADGSVVSPIQYAGTVTCNLAPTFSSASATLGCSATFNFSYTGTSPSYSVDLSLTSNFSTGVYLTFGSGTSSPIVVANPGTKWWNAYTQGRLLYYRIYNSDKSKSISGAATVSCATETLGTFTSVSGSLGCTPSFSFAYSGYSPTYRVDLSLTSNFSSGVYLDFGTGASSPIAVLNPKTKWSSYTHGRALYWRVWNAARSRVSASGGTTVNCPGL